MCADRNEGTRYIIGTGSRVTTGIRKGGENLKQKKCYIYTRVSTAAQTEGYSLDAQQKRLKDFAEYKGLEIAGEYCDAGKSGHSIKGRPAFMEMMDDITSGKDDISFVLVFKLSRFGRNAADVLKSMQTLMDYDIDLICVEDSIDSSTQGGRLTLAILSAVAEIERENIRIQFMSGKMQKVLQGGWAGGPIPYGYRSREGELVIEPSEAEVIRLIYEKYLEPPMKLNGVVRWLNSHGYQRISQETIRPFNSDFVSRILNNPFYCGKIVYYRRANKGSSEPKQEIVVQGKHEAIVTEKIWEQAQEKRGQLARVKGKRDEEDRISLLSGLVKCPVCGGGLISKKNKSLNHNYGGYYKTVYSYGCRNYRTSEGRVCSFCHTYNQERLDAAVMEVLQKVTGTEEFRTAFARTVGNQMSEEAVETQLKMLRKEMHHQEHVKYKLGMELDHLDVLAESYDQQYEKLQAEVDAAYDRIGRIEDKIEKLKHKLLRMKQGIHSSDNICLILNHFDRLYEKMNYEERRTLCRQFIQRIEVFPEKGDDKRILKSITFRFPVYFDLGGNQEEDGEDTPDEMVVFTLDCSRLPVTAAESKATYAEIKAHVLRIHGLKVSSLYIAQVKRKYGIEMGTAYNKPEKNKNHIPRCPKEKELAILDALKTYRMIPESTEYFEEAAE